MKKPQQIFFAQKKQRKILLVPGLSIQQLPALGYWKVMLLLLLLQKKCEYHKTCCDYRVAAACQNALTFLSASCKYGLRICEKVMHARSGAWRCCDGKGRAASVKCKLLLAATFILLCWTLNLHWYVLLGSSKHITSQDLWITAFSQINGCYFSWCPSCLTKALR